MTTSLFSTKGRVEKTMVFPEVVGLQLPRLTLLAGAETQQYIYGHTLLRLTGLSYYTAVAAAALPFYFSGSCALQLEKPVV